MSGEPVKRDPYAALRFRDFRLLFAGRFVAQIGEMMVSVAVGWELYERTGDAFALGLVGLVQVLPVMLLSVPGGYIADRYNRKWITLISQLVLVACSLGLMAISLTQGSLPVLYGVLAIIGAARAFNNPAESALTPQTVPPEYYYSAATWSSSIWQLSAILGPAVGGLIIAVSYADATWSNSIWQASSILTPALQKLAVGPVHSAAWVYLINAIAGLVLVVTLLLLRSKQRDYANEGETPMQSIRAGIAFVRNKQVILGSITLDMFAVLFGGATFLLPVFAKDILHTDATGLGILRAAPSVGALLMALIVARRPPFKQAGKTLLWAVAGFGIATLIFGISTSFWLSAAMLFATGALDNISVIIRHTLVLTQTPDAMRGRVNAVNSVFIGASNELGGFESGVAAALLGPVGAVVFGAFGTLGVVWLTAKLAPELRDYGTLGS